MLLSIGMLNGVGFNPWIAEFGYAIWKFNFGIIMIGLVVVSHCRLADEFVAATEHVLGEQEQIISVCIDPDDDIEQRRDDIVKAVKQVDSGKGVVVLTDMFGGTPSNLAISIMEENKVEVVAGINLPMLIKLVSIRDKKPLAQAVLEAQEAGRKYINIASNLLSQGQETKHG